MRSIVALLAAVPLSAFGAATQGAPLVGTTTTVNNGPGQQTDPHVSGNLCAYSNFDGTTSTIRYHDVSLGTDNQIPNPGTFDFLSDVNGTTIAFTRVSASQSAVFTYEVGAANALEVDPTPGAIRRAAQIATNLIVWQEHSTTSGASNIVAYDTVAHAATWITNDTSVNQMPAVSPDGTVVTWVKCAVITDPCDVWSATRSGGTWTTHQITNANGNCSHPDTNGQQVVYSCDRGTGDQLFWQPAAGGAEQSPAIPGNQTTPSVAGTFVAYAGLPPTASQHEAYVLDLSTSTYYQLTTGTGDVQLNDITAMADGTVRVVWEVLQADENVYAFSFKLATACQQGGDDDCDCGDHGDGDHGGRDGEHHHDGDGEGDGHCDCGDGHGHDGHHDRSSGEGDDGSGDGDGHHHGGHHGGDGDSGGTCDEQKSIGLAGLHLSTSAGTPSGIKIVNGTQVSVSALSAAQRLPLPQPVLKGAGCDSAPGSTALTFALAVLAWLGLARVLTPARAARRIVRR